jgi:hypothetical protein
VSFKSVLVSKTSANSAADGQTSDYIKVDVGDGSYITIYKHMRAGDDPYYLVIEVDNDEGYFPALKVVRNDSDVYEEGIE